MATTTKRKNTKKSKNAKVAFRPKNRWPQQIVVMAVFACLGAILLLRSYAAVNTITYQGQLTPSSTSQSYALTVGAGTLKATHDSKDTNMRVSLTNSDGLLLAQKQGAKGSISSTVQPGSYTVIIDYTAEKMKGSKKYSLNIEYPSGDTTNPTIFITSPLSGQVKNNVIISAQATDDTGIAKVEFSLDGALLSTLLDAPYTHSWDTTTAIDGTHTLLAKAYDTAGNFAVASIPVEIVNSPPIPTSPPTTSTPDNYPESLWHADADVDVDSGSNTKFWKKEVASNDYSRLSIVTDPKGLYGKVYKAYLSPSEISSGYKRAEYSQAMLGDGSTKLKLANDVTPKGSTQEIWLGWRSLFGKDLSVSNSRSNDGNYMQLKGDSSCGGPAVGMTIKYGRLTLRSEQFLTESDGIAWNGPYMNTLLDDNWHNFVMHVKFSKDPSVGFVEMWLDGKPQSMVNEKTRINFPTMCPNDTYLYPKIGVYGMDYSIGAGPHHWVESPRIGATYESVVPR